MKGQIELMHRSLPSSLSGVSTHTSEVTGHLEEFFFTTQANCWFLIQGKMQSLNSYFPKVRNSALFGTISNMLAKIQDKMSSMELEILILQPLSLKLQE